ncbi:MAG: fumarate reductase iron-sulfur subunit [Arcobacteraceae bacterium]
MSTPKGREITISALKFDPRSAVSKPHFVDYKLEETPGMTLFIALTKIREEQDADLSFDFVCRAGICGSCGMVVNGKPTLACRTLIANYPEGKLTLMPMPAFELIKDLSVNTGKWMDDMSRRVESWIHTNEVHDISKLEEKVDPDIADQTFELDRCIECGICVASCGTKLMRPDFIGPVGLNRVARFEVDPHDNRTAEDYYELIGDDDGVFGCMSLMACEDHCPKHLPLQNKIAYLRRKLVSLR